MLTTESEDELPNIIDVVHRRKTGQWIEGKVPRWATEYASRIGTKVGTSKFDQLLDGWYLRRLEKTLIPFAEAGAAVDPRSDGLAATIKDADGRAHHVTFDHLRAAARALGTGTRKREDVAQILSRVELVEGAILWKIRFRAAYNDKTRWLLLRESSSESSKMMEALGYDGQIMAKQRFQTSAPPERLTSLKANVISDEARLKAMATLSKHSLNGNRPLDEAFDTLVSRDRKERECRRIWSVVLDIHLTAEGGIPGQRLIRLSLKEGKPSEISSRNTELIISISPDGDAKMLFGDEPWRPKPGEPTWRVASYVLAPDHASKLVAGIAARSSRMIAEAISEVSDNSWMPMTEAAKVWVALTSASHGNQLKN